MNEVDTCSFTKLVVSQHAARALGSSWCILVQWRLPELIALMSPEYGLPGSNGRLGSLLASPIIMASCHVWPAIGHGDVMMPFVVLCSEEF